MATLEGTIHRRWALKAALNALLSVDRVFTGENRNKTDLPWCSLNRDSGFRKAQSSVNRIDATTIRFEICHDNFVKGRAITTQLCMAVNTTDGGGFHQDKFSIDDDGGNIASMILENEGTLQDERGTWSFFCDFVLTYQRP